MLTLSPSRLAYDIDVIHEVAQAYLEYLYSAEGQDIIGKHYYRPRSAAAAKKYGSRFPKLNLVCCVRIAYS